MDRLWRHARVLEMTGYSHRKPTARQHQGEAKGGVTHLAISLANPEARADLGHEAGCAVTCL